jgi:hypothetical protein
MKDGLAANYLKPFIFCWWPDTLDPAPPSSTSYHTRCENPVGVHRSSWTDANASLLMLKGGLPDTSHCHLDAGSFIFESDGVRWAIDLGAQDYNSLETAGITLWDYEQDSDRWTVFRLNNFSHNTLMIQDTLHNVKGDSPITQAGNGYTVVEMTSLLTPHLASANRGAKLLEDRRALIRDELTGAQDNTRVRWAMMTDADIAVKNQQATLSKDGKTLNLELRSPSNISWQIFKTDPPPNTWDEANPGTKMIGFYVELNKDQSATLEVLFTPGSVKNTASVDSVPLTEWK